MSTASDDTTATSVPALLPAETTIGAVTLRVADAERSLRWYRDMLGMDLIERTPERLTLGAGGKPFLFLDVRPGSPPRDENTTGLYHVAFLVPDRAVLGGVLARIAAKNVKLGASDHLVSEALYIWDEDNNGLEIYRDRPRNKWVWNDKQVRMATEPLDLRNLLNEGVTSGEDKKPLPAGSRVGHVHLQVGDLDAARKFYTDIVGFELTTNRYNGALFVSAGGYHHHVGMNVWHSRNGPPPAPNAAGLVEFEIVVPDHAAVTAAKARLENAGFAVSGDADSIRGRDPWQTPFRIRTPQAA